MKKKVITLLLCVTMLCSLCVTAFAAGAGMDNFAATQTYSSTTFKDVPTSQWYAQSVKLCYEYGLMGGKGGGAFSPAGNLTVAEAIVMADRVYEIYTTGASTLKNGSPWYKTYVDFALEKGIIKAGDFSNYDAKITRAQMAYIFANAMPQGEYAAMNNVTSVPDVKTTDKYAQAIYMLYNAGILTGSDVYGNFKPASNIQRSEAAAIIIRVALVSQRQSVVLYKDFTEGIVRFAMPIGTERNTTQGMPMYLYQQDVSKNCNTVVYSQTNSAYAGYTIMDVASIADAEKQIVEAMKQKGLTATAESRSTVKFGTVTAYKFVLSTVSQGVTMTQYEYCFLTGSTYYEVAVTSVNAQVAKNISATITVNGNVAK